MNYRDFVDSGIVFLEAPYIDLEPDALATRPGIRRAIRRAVARREHEETTGSSEPSAVLNDYDDGAFYDDNLKALGGSLIRLYREAKVGDLVIVPGRETHDGFMRSVVRIGEISTPFSRNDIYSGARAITKKVPVRHVRWLRVVARRDISPLLERKIGKPPAVRALKIEKETEQVLKIAYNSYIFEGNSSSLVIADRYDGSDFVTLNRSSDLIAFLVSAHAIFAVPDPGGNKVKDIEEFTKEHFKDASVDNIEIAFASPGYWRIAGATASLAAFVALGIAVFTSGIGANDLSHGIEVTNSIAPHDPTAKYLEQSMNFLLKSFDKIELQKVIKEAVEAKKEIGLQSPTKITN